MDQYYEIEEYLDDNGISPFGEWLLGLKDKKAQLKLHARIRRAELGNLGDWKDIKGVKGLYEMREHYGQGFRVFYTIRNRKVILLLAGSTKQDQKKVIAKAQEYLFHYQRNREDDKK